ncbi:hypothetical protein C8J56DRAFT_205189 [Mycena floridula]|nr:hypothetical protein C8J56DRAFT_205189 [Mycena floridula]
MGIASIMGSISEFLDGSSEDINLLPDKLRALLEQQSNDQESLNQRYHRISMLMSQIHEIHPSLDQDLIKALTDLQPKIQREDASLQAFISTAIEASLVKLSVIRARAHLSLYNGSTPSALEAAYRKAQQDESALEADELELDRQLAKYTQVMQLVNASEKDSPFAQIIEDWALVKKETDECRRDLRRLGWTGD